MYTADPEYGDNRSVFLLQFETGSLCFRTVLCVVMDVFFHKPTIEQCPRLVWDACPNLLSE